MQYLLAVAFWLLGVAGALAHLLANFVNETPDDQETPKAFRAYFRMRVFKLALSVTLFSFTYIIWLGMRSWGQNFQQLAPFQGIMYGVFMSVAGWAADSIWRNGMAYAEKKAAQRLNGGQP